ncbi:MAG: class I SAM-dependent methyltransferase [Erythrobacter sp.]|uniref:class I SAM-dependent methyltransferase n=1 Tax=Erythrobacter sp. TaxID=1042 RepID=UPI0025CFD579|nr:class I SAM-dependent methyltransferase [Erythrobacter sp.]MCM0000445.1 class I SAM-dependent methyltransferase [Erythrobacter sp.]
MSERLKFWGKDAEYDSYAFSQHVGRYIILRKLVKRARVLDISCGEGYGTRLLKGWGAREVVGIDISEEALGSARYHFAGKGISFVRADIDAEAERIAELGKFDVIVSFETIEHLKDPRAFLDLIERVCSDKAIIAISAPCEEAGDHGQSLNPFHLWHFSFDEFRDLTEGRLGAAAQWLLGTPAFGEMNFILNDTRVSEGHKDPIVVMDMRFCDLAAILPSKWGNGVSQHTCAHYVGVWGAKPGANAVVSGQTFAQFREPWQVIEWQREQIARLEAELARQNVIISGLNEEKKKRAPRAPSMAKPKSSSARSSKIRKN